MNLQLRFSTRRIGMIFTSLFVLINFSLSAQTTWEFDGTPYQYQKTHFDSATSVIKNKLGIQMHTFGAPYNQIDTTFIRVMSEDTNYKVLLLGQNNPRSGSGQINLTRRVQIESATGVPDYNYFLTSYNSLKGSYTDYMIMQGHPYAWTTAAKQTEFHNIINFLISEGVKFTTPYEYYKYLTDLSIPRTTKVQVMLKFDDIRATTTYFTPCFTAYDFLVSNKIKAGFGVNNMSNLTQIQVDTLNYYLRQTDSDGTLLFELWNHGLDHSMNASTVGGNWSDPASWTSGAVPTAADDAEIPAGVTITIDIPNAVCQDLTVNGTLAALNTAATGLTVNGDLLINTGGTFTSPYLSTGTFNIVHSLTVYGDFTNAGGTFDFRTGSSGTTMRVLNTTFTGNTNSTIKVGTYTSTNNDFNGITINKTGAAKVICGSDVFLDQGASSCVSQLILTSGNVETGDYSINVLSTAAADIVTPSVSSYVVGSLGRGMSNSGGKSNLFPIGDANSYRPITIKSTTGGVGSGHYATVRCIPGKANLNNSTYTNGVDTVSQSRHYQLTYNKGIGTGATSMSFSQFSPTYGSDDGVNEGNTNLRVAYSTDGKLTWNGMDQTPAHTTSITTPPTRIDPTALATPLLLNSGSGSIYISLAKATGTYDNPFPVELSSFVSSVNNGVVNLNWKTATEINSALFEVEKSVLTKDVQGSRNWETIASIKGAGTSNSLKQYSFVDKKCSVGRNSYRLKMIDNNGTYKYSNSIEVVIETPKNYSLQQNYPNPFNPVSTIRYELPAISNVKINVIDILGRQVEQLANEIESPGMHEVVFNASNLASGIYYYTIQANSVDGKAGFKDVKKMMMMK